MREIKFRGYRVDGQGWAYGNYLVLNGLQYMVCVSDQGYESRFQVDKDSVGQYTGIKDSNGVEIYEGDLVNWIDSDENKRQDEVRFIKGGFVLCNDQYTVGSYVGKSLEVVGNVYANHS